MVPSAPLVRRRIAALGAPVGFGERGGRGGSPALPCMRWPEPIACEPMYEPIIAPLRPIKVCDCDRRIARIASVAAVSSKLAAWGMVLLIDYWLRKRSQRSTPLSCVF